MDNQTQPNPAPVPETNSELNKPVIVKQNPLLPILIVLVIILLGTTGFLVYQNMQLQKQITQMKTSQATVGSSPTPMAYASQAPSASATPDSTTGLKTYTGTGFSFKYPSIMSSLTASEAGISGPWTGNPQDLVLLADKTTLRSGTDAPFNGFAVTLVDLGGTSFDAYLGKEVSTEKSSPRGIESTTITKTFAGNQPAAYIDSEASIRRYFVALPNGQNAVALSTASRSDSFLNTMNQILSSFQFTN